MRMRAKSSRDSVMASQIPGNTPKRRRGPYRSYLRDSNAPVPRATSWRLRKREISGFKPSNYDVDVQSVWTAPKLSAGAQSPSNSSIAGSGSY